MAPAEKTCASPGAYHHKSADQATNAPVRRQVWAGTGSVATHYVMDLDMDMAQTEAGLAVCGWRRTGNVCLQQ